MFTSLHSRRQDRLEYEIEINVHNLQSDIIYDSIHGPMGENISNR